MSGKIWGVPVKDIDTAEVLNAGGVAVGNVIEQASRWQLGAAEHQLERTKEENRHSEETVRQQHQFTIEKLKAEFIAAKDAAPDLKKAELDAKKAEWEFKKAELEAEKAKTLTYSSLLSTK
jgi:hypothetical protein